MPLVLDQPRLLHPSLTALPSATGVVLLALTGILKSPADQPHLPVVIANAHRCLQVMQARLPNPAGALTHLASELAIATHALAEAKELNQPAGMIGRVSKHKAWALCSSDLDRAPLALLESIGFEIARAYLTQGAFLSGPAADLYRIQQKFVNTGLCQEELDRLENYVLSQCRRMQPIFADRAAGLDASTAAFNAQVVASIRAQTSSLRVEERQAAGRIFEMTQSELAHVATDLKKQVEAGDPRALQAALAFSIGLPWELSLKVPFFTDKRCPAVVWINPVDQCVYIDLERVLPGLSKKQTDRHVPTTMLLTRPLPLLLGNLVYEACAANPGLEAVEGLAGKSSTISRSLLPGASIETAIRASVARLIASRGGAALRAGLSRDTAAYAALSLSLISKSDHHYLVKQRSAIWQGCGEIYASLQWGPCVPDPDAGGAAFGSRVTPGVSWITDVIEELQSVAIQLRPGKRYRLNSLIRHHNAYAAYVGLLMTILVGGRSRSKIEFCARTWQERSPFGQHGDKLVGPTLGLTPVPIPTTLSAQMTLWRTHLGAFDHRLEKLGLQKEHPGRLRIQAILKGDEVNLLFTMSDEGTPQMLFEGEGKSLNRDFSRHVMPDLLAAHEVPFEQVQWWLRHHVDGTSASAITSTTVQHVWLSRVATALDRIALDLGLSPLHGIAKAL
jgi:hypothetical protein